MAVKQSQAAIVGDKIHLHFLVSAHHHNILHHASGRLAGELGQFETVTVMMDGMNVIPGIADAVALPQLQMVGGCHRIAQRNHVLGQSVLELGPGPGSNYGSAAGVGQATDSYRNRSEVGECADRPAMPG
jgi:hypothetical protein